MFSGRILFVSCFISMTISMVLDSALTGSFLDTITKTENTQCGSPTLNKTKPYFFGVTDLKCLNIEARLRRNGLDIQDIQNLRAKFPRLIGKRSADVQDSSYRQKRSPSRSTLRPVHRWIFYDGYFIEFGAGSGNIPAYIPNEPTTTTTPMPQVLYAALVGHLNTDNSTENQSNNTITTDKNRTNIQNTTAKNRANNQKTTAKNKQNDVDLSNANMQTLYPKNGDICAAKMESETAGYSSVSLECLYKCARSYVSKFGEYHLIKNNCHIFANTISDILCTGICPEWCK